MQMVLMQSISEQLEAQSSFYFSAAIHQISPCTLIPPFYVLHYSMDQSLIVVSHDILQFYHASSNRVLVSDRLSQFFPRFHKLLLLKSMRLLQPIFLTHVLYRLILLLFCLWLWVL